MEKYKICGKKGEGTFSEVLRGECIDTKLPVAVKYMKHPLPKSAKLSEIVEVDCLQKLSPHPHVIQLYDVLFDEATRRVALVFELMELNLYEKIQHRRQPLEEKVVKQYMWQLFSALDHMHSRGIFHRDIKPENILLKGDVVKLADFGSCRRIDSTGPYTEYISTRWYRPPECLLTDGFYDYRMDIWGAGCVLFEIATLCPLFPGANEIDQINKIHKIIGKGLPEGTAQADVLLKWKHETKSPQSVGKGLASLMPNSSPECRELLEKLLAYRLEDRISAAQALQHRFFDEIRIIPIHRLPANAPANPIGNQPREDTDRSNINDNHKRPLETKSNELFHAYAKIYIAQRRKCSREETTGKSVSPVIARLGQPNSIKSRKATIKEALGNVQDPNVDSLRFYYSTYFSHEKPKVVATTDVINSANLLKKSIGQMPPAIQTKALTRTRQVCNPFRKFLFPKNY